jgi:hypothetical protein
MEAELLLLPSSSGHDITVLSLPEAFSHRLGHRPGSACGGAPRHCQRRGPCTGHRCRRPASAAWFTTVPLSGGSAAGERPGYRQPAARRPCRRRRSCSMSSSARGARVLRRPHAGQGASAEGHAAPVALVPRAVWLPSPAPAGYRGRLPNQALKLTRLSPCLLGGRASAHNLAMPCTCISPAVQLNAGVRQRLARQRLAT